MTRPTANGDGTYNGIAVLSKLSGLSYDEIEWMAKRTMELRGQYSKETVVAMIKDEARSKPWLPVASQG